MKAVIYIRVSTLEQVQGTSLDSQTRACLDFAKRQNLTVDSDGIFREEGESAKIMERPQLAKMLDYCSKNKGDVTHCIVWKVDRLARKMEYHLIIKSALAKSGVRLLSVTEPIEENPMGALMENMLAAFAQFDNEIRLARTVGGMKARTEQGGWPHDAPYGYQKSRTPTGISTVSPDNNATTAKRFLEIFSAGHHTIEQATDLAFNMGIHSRRGKKKGWQSIKNILTNPLYAGYVRSKYTEGNLIRGVHQALIDDRTYYRNQAIIAGNLKHFSREAEVDWPLRGGFLKHFCGVAMTGSSPRGSGGPSPRYSCPKCRAKTCGKQISRSRAEVHDQFISLMERVKPSEELTKLFREVVLREWNKEFQDALSASIRLEAEISELKSRKSRIIDLYIDGKLTENDKHLKLIECDKKLNELSLLMVNAGNYTSEKEQIIDGAMLFMAHPNLFWSVANIEIKKRVQDLIFPEGLTYDCVEGFGTPTLSNSYLLIRKIAPEEAKNSSLVAATGIEPVTLGL